MKLTIKDSTGNSRGEVDVQFSLVEGGRATQAVHDAVTAYMAAQRSGTACTKTMGEVAGTGKKPWRQKGTGRARAGSFQSPLWRGGGVVFGPKPRDYSKKVNRSAKQLALRKALGERMTAGDVILVDDLKLTSPKTKDFVSVLSALGVTGTALIITSESDRNLLLSARNVDKVEVTTSQTLNTYQVLRADRLIFIGSAFAKIEERLKQDQA